jgi:uncharacterized membrane protein
MIKGAPGLALIVVTILLVFVALQPVIPSNSQAFSELAILGPNQSFGGYPTSVVVGQQVFLYGYIANHEGLVNYYQLLVKLGNQTTQISNSTYAQAPIVLTRSTVLGNNQSVTFPLDIGLNQTGINVRLIFELWAENATTAQFEYTGTWNQLLLNVTS